VRLIQYYKNESTGQIHLNFVFDRIGEPSDGSPASVIRTDEVRKGDFGGGEECSAAPTKYFNTYHGHTRHHNRQRLHSDGAQEMMDHKRPIRFTDDIPSPTPSPPQPQIHLSSDQLKQQTKYPPFSTPPTQRSRFDSPITNESEVSFNQPFSRVVETSL